MAVPRTSATEVIVYADAAAAGRVGRVLEGMGERVRCLGVAGERTGALNELAGRLGAAVEPDLRKLLIDRPASYLLLGTLAGLELDDLQPTRAAGTTVLTLDPIAGDLTQLAAVERAASGSGGGGGGNGNGGGSGGGGGGGLRVVHLPPFMLAPGPLGCPDPMVRLGRRRVASMFSGGPAEEATLFSRLFDAWRTLLQFCELPETIDATVTPDISPPGATTAPPEGLRGLTGSVAAHARLPDGGAAAVHVSDRHARHARRVHVLGDTGEVCLDDTAWRLYQRGPSPDSDPEAADAKTRDAAPPRLIDQGDARPLPTGDPGEGIVTWPGIAAWQWHRLLDRPAATATQRPMASLAEPLACCEACLLSARTGQPESPWKMLEIGR